MRSRSLRVQLTGLTAILVSVACLVLNAFVSSSAIGNMEEMENSVVAVLPVQEGGNTEVRIEADGNFTQDMAKMRKDFQVQSLLVTLAIAACSSAVTWIALGYALRPLEKFTASVEQVEAQNISTPVVVEHASLEIARLQTAFNNMRTRLDTAFETQKQYSACAAHELRTPLAVLRTRLEVLQKKPDPTREEVQSSLCRMDEQMSRLENVIQVLLEMSTMSSVEKKDPVHFSELVEEVLCDLEEKASQRKITLHQEEGDAITLGNEALVQRAIYNLVENAVKYGKEGGTVTVWTQVDEKFVRVYVFNEGAPIAKEEWKKLFMPFYRGQKERNGAGLGLALVSEIAKVHGGCAEVVESDAGGTVFSVSFVKV